MPNNWPVNIKKHEIVRFIKTSRPDGFDMEVVIRAERTNGTTMESSFKGRVTDYTWGREWVADMAIRGAAILQPGQLPTHIATKIIHGEQVGNMRSCSIEATTRYEDGHTTTNKQVTMLPLQLPDMSPEEYVQRLQAAFSGRPFDQIFLGNEPDTSS